MNWSRVRSTPLSFGVIQGGSGAGGRRDGEGCGADLPCQARGFRAPPAIRTGLSGRLLLGQPGVHSGVNERGNHGDRRQQPCGAQNAPRARRALEKP